MKNLLVLITVFATFSTTASAHESVEDSKHVIVSTLVDFEVNQQWLGYIDQGSVSINLTDETMTLTLMSQPDCDPTMVCPAVMLEYHQIEMQLTSRSVNTCGAVTYIGEKDKTPVDGLKETIEVIDYQAMTCEIAVPYMTSVSYITFNPWTQDTTVSYFAGEPLYVLPNFF